MGLVLRREGSPEGCRASPTSTLCRPHADGDLLGADSRQGRFIGVVTADLAMDYFRRLRGSMGALDLGPQTYCFIVSSGGRILAHRDDRFEFPSGDSEVARLPVDPSFRELLGRMARESGGMATAIDFADGGRATFRFCAGSGGGLERGAGDALTVLTGWKASRMAGFNACNACAGGPSGGSFRAFRKLGKLALAGR